MVAWPVVAGDTGPVDGKYDMFVVQAHVKVGLVKRAGKKGGVDGKYGCFAGVGEPCRHGGGVLFGDTDVEHLCRTFLGELQQASRAGHGRGDGNNVWVVAGTLGEPFTKDTRPAHP